MVEKLSPSEQAIYDLAVMCLEMHPAYDRERKILLPVLDHFADLWGVLAVGGISVAMLRNDETLLQQEFMKEFGEEE